MIQVFQPYAMGVRTIAMPPITFSKTVQYRLVLFDGAYWHEFTITLGSTVITVNTSSGTLPDDSRIWMCGAGAGGEGQRSNVTTVSAGGGGGGGGYCGMFIHPFSDGSVSIGTGGSGGSSTVSAAGGSLSRFNQYYPHLNVFEVNGGKAPGTAYNGCNGGAGGSGGGAGAYSAGTSTVTNGTPGVGAGVSTVPFDDTVNWQPLCAGGGAGAFIYSSPRRAGGNGGSNGADGGLAYNPGGYPYNGGTGGILGGGNGAGIAETGDFIASTAASGYGAGGGGGAVFKNSGAHTRAAGSRGSNGVVILRVRA
jgi:hypothetical protein